MPDPPGSLVVALRMASCLQVFAERDRPLVREAIAKVVERLGSLSNEALTRAKGRVGDLDVLWEALPGPSVDRIRDVVAALPLPSAGQSWEGVTSEQADLLSVSASAPAREVLPILVERFEGTSVTARAAAMARRVSPFFMP